GFQQFVFALLALCSYDKRQISLQTCNKSGGVRCLVIEGHMLETTTATQYEVLKKNDFDKLFRDHRAMIIRVAYSVLKCRQDAEDVLQKVFTQLLDGKCRTQLVTSPKAYLRR